MDPAAVGLVVEVSVAAAGLVAAAVPAAVAVVPVGKTRSCSCTLWGLVVPLLRRDAAHLLTGCFRMAGEHVLQILNTLHGGLFRGY